MRRRPLGVFEEPWVLLCEGQADKRFFDRLIRDRKIDSHFAVHFPARDDRDAGGKSKFGKWLDNHWHTSESFKTTVKAILVVADNDNNETESFEFVRKQIQKADGFPVPNTVQTVARTEGFPVVVVLMIPMDGPGNLETLCLRATEKWGLSDALNTFVATTPANDWNLGKQSKMKLQVTLAATCKRKPDTSFAQHWCQGPRYRIPVDNACFDPVEKFLTDFGSLIS